MKNKPINFILTLYVLIFVLFPTGILFTDTSAAGREVIVSDGEITLKEAINIGFQRAKEWNVSATLTSVNSVDETMGGSRGETGKRFNWFMTFVVPGTDDFVLIGISEKKITLFRPGKQSQDPTIPYDEIKFDSSDVLQLAKDKYGLKKGKKWATGYHFTLDSIEGKPILTVVGNDRDNRFTRISFNAKNGDIVSAIHKLPYGGGLISKRIGTDTVTKKGMAIMGVVARNNNLVVWGDKKPTQFSTSKQHFIELSHNNGEAWTELQVNNYVTHAWFNKNDQLYAATEKELWAGITSKSKGTKILSLDHKIERIDYSINNHIAVISNGNIYRTNNQGESWKQAIIPQPFFVVQISNNGDLVGLTEERKVLQKTNDGWKEITMPNRNDEPSDMIVINNRIFITTKSGIWTRDLQEGNWRKIKVDEEIVNFIKKGEKLFGYTYRDEAIYSINIKDARKPEKVFDAVDLVVMDVDIIGDTLWIATIPGYSWEEMTIPQRR
ncbi:WD40/YVTN/BNR-like repeat-containing protein [Viridibacillus sp. NPDC096237]|uniref:WD40/YVTN/BNR-like repeat-containing protein n=1 Tax=Viridibacillus sp. NPDC096237 TaxID=3390721 RepID=UPI003D0125F4